MQIPIDSPDIRAVYLMDRSGSGSRRFNRDKNPRIARIERKVIDYWRAKAQLTPQEVRDDFRDKEAC